MEFNEVKEWAELNIHDYNTRQAFLLITNIIYDNTFEVLNDVDMYWRWFKEKWYECLEIANKNDKWRENEFCLCILKALRIFYDSFIVESFGINKKLDCFKMNYDYKFKTDYNGKHEFLKLISLDILILNEQALGCM